jgi:hypothetical protein
MKLRPLLTTVLAASFAASALAADPAAEDTAKKSKFKDAIKARMVEDAKKAPPTPAKPAPPAESTASATPSATTQDAAAKEAPTVLPKVEVRRDRITVLDQQLALQEKEIAREKVNTKASEMDKALNDSRLAKPLSIFGGESASHREGIAKERVSLMETEKDLIEAIAQAKTKEQKAELQKQLEEIKSYRRELERSLR